MSRERGVRGGKSQGVADIGVVVLLVMNWLEIALDDSPVATLASARNNCICSCICVPSPGFSPRCIAYAVQLTSRLKQTAKQHVAADAML